MSDNVFESFENTEKTNGTVSPLEEISPKETIKREQEQEKQLSDQAAKMTDAFAGALPSWNIEPPSIPVKRKMKIRKEV